MHNYHDEDSQFEEEEGDGVDGSTHTLVQINCNDPHPIDVSLAVVDIFVKAGCVSNTVTMAPNEFMLYNQAIGALTDMIKKSRQLEADPEGDSA